MTVEDVQTNDWRSGASLSNLRARARCYQQIRDFFERRQLLEIDAPLMAASPATDPHIAPIVARCEDRDYYLQSSPEYALKRLLASVSGELQTGLYSLGKAFRDAEQGRRHNPEFTMLEWYRLGYDEQQLIEEVAELVQALVSVSEVKKYTYRQLFQRYCQLDPHTASLTELKAKARQQIDIDWDDDSRDSWLDILITHIIEPQLVGDSAGVLTFIYDYPASQAALAKIAEDETGQLVARRFEAFLDGVELANGYWELTDAVEQARRFDADIAERRRLGLPTYPQDARLLSALADGMPDCAGVALGVDRLLMQALAATSISETMSFDIGRA